MCFTSMPIRILFPVIPKRGQDITPTILYPGYFGYRIRAGRKAPIQSGDTRLALTNAILSG